MVPMEKMRPFFFLSLLILTKCRRQVIPLTEALCEWLLGAEPMRLLLLLSFSFFQGLKSLTFSLDHVDSEYQSYNTKSLHLTPLLLIILQDLHLGPRSAPAVKCELL